MYINTNKNTHAYICVSVCVPCVLVCVCVCLSFTSFLYVLCLINTFGISASSLCYLSTWSWLFSSSFPTTISTSFSSRASVTSSRLFVMVMMWNAFVLHNCKLNGRYHSIVICMFTQTHLHTYIYVFTYIYYKCLWHDTLLLAIVNCLWLALYLCHRRWSWPYGIQPVRRITTDCDRWVILTLMLYLCVSQWIHPIH